MSNPSIKWMDRHQQVRQIVITDRICIGRTCKGMDPQKRIRLEDPRVSRDHAEIVCSAGRLKIVDSSCNGTWVNDIRMSAGSFKFLSDGDRVRVGDVVFLVVYPQAAADVVGDDPITELTKISSVTEVVTALMADIRGFSAYAQRHPSTEVYGMIKKIFNNFSMIVEEFQGTIKDYAGDAIFAFWEHRFEDAVTQSILACRAAIRQMQSFADLRVALAGRYPDAEKLQIGWGITTGPITLSPLGSRAADLAVVGDCVNLAARLSGIANKDITEDILICAHTARLVGERFDLQDLGLLSIRGRKGTERIFTLTTA